LSHNQRRVSRRDSPLLTCILESAMTDRGSATGRLTETLLARTLEAAVQDRQTVTPNGVETAPLIDGVTFWEISTHSDERGSIQELYNPAWNWHKDPLVYAYCFHDPARHGEGLEPPQAARGSLLPPAGRDGSHPLRRA
jgi:hypothetical protein